MNVCMCVSYVAWLTNLANLEKKYGDKIDLINDDVDDDIRRRI